MKKSSAKPGGFASTCRSATLAATLLLASGLATLCQAAPFDTPAGSGSFTWDCLMSGGSQPGIAFLTFTTNLDAGGNFTFSGYAVVAGMPKNGDITDAVADRTPNGEVGRKGSATSTSASTSTTNFFVFGFVPVSGMWRFDNKGRIVGNFFELINVTAEAPVFHAIDVTETITNVDNPAETTNIVAYFADGAATYETNYFWVSTSTTNSYTFDNPNFTVVPVAADITNHVSFSGSVVPGRRLTLVNSTSFGKATYKGIPADTTPTFPILDGSGWNGQKRQNGQTFQEFFGLHSFAGSNPFSSSFPDLGNFPNIYWTTNGIGPGYTYYGIVVVSKQKKSGFAIFESTDGGYTTTLRSTLGSFSSKPKGTKASTKGVIEPDTIIKFNAEINP